MKKKWIYNLEFPSWCTEITMFGYRFTRLDDYGERVVRLQHLVGRHSEFRIPANTGENVITAYVELPENEEEAVLEWSGSNSTALSDILLLLSILSGRDVFVVEKENISDSVLINDPRMYQWGGVLICSIPYKERSSNHRPFNCNIGFEEGLNQIYELIRSEEWQRTYHQGYFLFLARQAFRRQSLESAFIQCWTIWEHLFAVLNRNWLSSNQIRQLSSFEKISYLLVKYALRDEIDNVARQRVQSLAGIRNRLIHFGRFPEGAVHEDAVLFIRLTEFIIAKILRLSPSNVFDTMQHLEDFLCKDRT